LGPGLVGDEDRSQFTNGRTSNHYPKGYRGLTDRAATLDEICELFYRRRISFYCDQIDSQELGMGTAEWIALGLLSFILLIGWLRSVSTWQDQKKDASPGDYGKKTAKQES
jgi:hypothetical protein